MFTGPDVQFGGRYADPVILSPAQIDALPPDRRERYHAVLRSLLGRESLAAYVARTSPREPLPAHGRLLADTITRSRLVQTWTGWSWPPGHAKTTLCERALAWALTESPADTSGFVSYSDPKATKHSRRIRAMVRQRIPLDPANQSAGDWSTIYGGGLWAGGWRGKATGYRASGAIVIDDPYKRIDEALSASYRRSLADWLKMVAETRSQGGSIILTHTRWADGDLLGELHERELRGEGRWRIVNIPAIAEDGDLLGRAPGEALWPEQYPAESCKGPCGHAGHLDAIRESIGEWAWAALFQGRPSPNGSGMFPADQWTIVDRSLAHRPAVKVRAWDIAGTEDQTDARNPKAAATCGVYVERDDTGEIRYGSPFYARIRPEAVDAAIVAMAEIDGRDTLISLPQDPGQAGVAQAAHWRQMLESRGYRVSITPEGWATDGLASAEDAPSSRVRSKIARARPYAAALGQGTIQLLSGHGYTGVWVPETRSLILQRVPDWSAGWIDEHSRFPRGTFCDRVDAGSRGYAEVMTAFVDAPSVGPRIY